MNKAILQQLLDDFLDSRDFYELMQAYRHYQVAASSPFESVKSALRAAIAQPEQPAPVAQEPSNADSRDAERYRWLRDQSNWSDDGICPMVASCEDTLYGEALDKAVDAAKDATP